MRMRLVRQPVQHLPLSSQPVRRDRGGLPVHPPVDPGAELAVGLFQLREAAVSRQQVRLRRHQVGLGRPSVLLTFADAALTLSRRFR
jgi:hypothetical protein